MQRVRQFFWRTSISLPTREGSFTWSEPVWIHDEGFIRDQGDDWRVLSTSVIGFDADSGQALMMATMAKDEESSIPDTAPDL